MLELPLPTVHLPVALSEKCRTSASSRNAPSRTYATILKSHNRKSTLISYPKIEVNHGVENDAGESRVVKSTHSAATSPSSAGCLRNIYMRWSDSLFVTVKVVGIWKNPHTIRLYKVYLERPPIMPIVHFCCFQGM